MSNEESQVQKQKNLPLKKITRGHKAYLEAHC